MIEQKSGRDSADEQRTARDDRGNPPTPHDPILAIPGGLRPRGPPYALTRGGLSIKSYYGREEQKLPGWES
jgi:hypothetical protein